MTAGPDLARLDLASFSERLAARTPTPGGGSVAAYLVAAGAGLVAMAFRFTSGPKYAAVEGAMGERASALEEIRVRAIELVDADSSSYDAVTAAYGLPKTTDAEKVRRTAAVQRALIGALEVPLETMGKAVAALRIAAAGAPDINKNLASDCATGSWCLWSAAEGAALNVKINAASLADRGLAEMRLAECERILREASALAESARTSAARHLP
ncbi:MAG TPA: cyclodeaminase/cyclohydrolase family protein [Planctomycetota bacterium]|jgi:formiminotetrahydrofolate cyclodeaminase|nr:cyclodeaminase/cyclohydrolase family protein [Planctomycetota bacterium]